MRRLLFLPRLRRLCRCVSPIGRGRGREGEREREREESCCSCACSRASIRMRSSYSDRKCSSVIINWVYSRCFICFALPRCDANMQTQLTKLTKPLFCSPKMRCHRSRLVQQRVRDKALQQLPARSQRVQLRRLQVDVFCFFRYR